MVIQPAVLSDLDGVLDIYEQARRFMAKTGNPTQWGESYPPEELVRNDILSGHLFLAKEDGEACGVFAFFPEGDPDYDRLDGWQNDAPYAAIHRVASAGTKKGVLSAIVSFALTKSSNLKIDTHEDNRVMQAALEKQGFVSCGVREIPLVGRRILYQLYKENPQ